MPSDNPTTQHPVLTSGSTALPTAIHTKLLELEVESTYNRHDLCMVTFDIDAKTEIPPALELGKPFEIAFRPQEGGAAAKVFEGEITALEFDSRDHRSVMIVQAECKFHRLFRNDHIRTWIDKTVSDAIAQVVRDAGLQAEIESTSSVLPFQMQQNETDGDWLLERAREQGFHVRFKEGKVFWGKVGAGGDSGVTLELNKHLQGFNCRATANTFVKEAVVRSWDAVQKKMIEGKATSFSGRKDSKVAGAFDEPTMLLNRPSLGSVAEAKASAQAVIDRANEHNLQAEGRCWGKVELAVDKEVAIKGVNQRFDGKYRISHVRHTYTKEQGFTTEFACRGLADQSLSALVSETASGFASSAPDRGVFEGVAVAMVTANNDPEGLGRVKVKIPALADDTDFGWMRTVFPGGGGHGGHHGWYLLPEVKDEVLVVFEQGDARRGYVIGGLVNGQEKPHKDFPNSKVLGGDNVVNQHLFLTRSGSHLLFDEDKDLIEIANKDAKFFLRYSSDNGVEIENTSSADKFTLTNEGVISIVSKSGDISIDAKGKLSLKAGGDISIEGGGAVNIKASGDASVEGTNAKLTGQVAAKVSGAQAELIGSGTTTVKGSVVLINS